MKKRMELKEFVAMSLKEIIGAVYDVQQDENIKQTNAIINPHVPSRTPDAKVVDDYSGANAPKRLVKDVDFDVVVTITSKKGTKGGIAVLGGVFALGSQGESSSSNDIASRLKFSIPVALPIEKK